MAVHATVPFVAMLRKAVLLPPWAVGITVLGAIAGQQLGAKVERQRLAGELPLLWPLPAPAAAGRAGEGLLAAQRAAQQRPCGPAAVSGGVRSSRLVAA